ncbi:MAG: 16S rRNA (cytosine(1402)-N(4))-methyltransferase RsmH [Candidatus Pacebacteria bacterium]|nr:16S rRNA (cytosine(1402)-N(4))-methyltransferase RsmH [Candidatus Paceibacterota bacterium]
MNDVHRPVMINEVISYLAPKPGSRLLDGTVGFGGHAEALLQASDDVEILGIDRDWDALTEADKRLTSFGDRVHLAHGRYSEMQKVLGTVGWDLVDGVLLDLGVSSAHLDRPERGFSFRFDAPLDMRMDQRASTTAATILNTADEAELRRIFQDYGEERKAGRVARAVVRRRKERPWSRTKEFAELVTRIVGPARHGHLPPPTRCFQALRIAVNDELGELKRGLDAAVEVLASGGRLVVVSFHSLEDRIVKHVYREAAKTCICPPDFPECRCQKQATLRVLTRKPVQASDAELAVNPRASSAKLRAAERLPTQNVIP